MTVTTTFGEVALSSGHTFSHWPGKFKYSPLCQEQIVYCGQIEVYEQASQLAHRLAGIKVSDSTIQRMCTHYGQELGEDLYDADKRQAALQSPPAGQVGQADSQKLAQQAVVYAQFDGGFMFSDADWQEVKLGRTFLKSDCQVVENEDRGNRIVRSEYAASLGHYRAFTDKFSVLIEEARRADRKLVFITDAGRPVPGDMDAQLVQQTKKSPPARGSGEGDPPNQNPTLSHSISAGETR